MDDSLFDPVEAIKTLNNARDTVLIARNLHMFLEAPEVVQVIQNGIPRWKAMGNCLVMIAPYWIPKPELEKVFTVIDLPLPTTDDIHKIQVELGKSLEIEPDRKASRAARGLTEEEAETCFALSLIKKGSFSTDIVNETKAQMIRKSGLMQLWNPEDIQNVGGLDNLKHYIQSRSVAFSEDSTLPKPKGILLAGIPGTGKSLSCKAAANLLGFPLIRLDISALKGSLVGQSEMQMRQALSVIEAFGESIVWIDEVEKAFSGTKSNHDSDGGATAGMLGTFLTFLQEATAPIFVMATANDISKLPSEFMRAGRFDATFFVDTPCRTERIEIIEIMNRKYGTDIPESFADKTNSWTGAEIEQLAKDSLFDGLEIAHKSIVPLSITMREDIQKLKDWAKSRARLANTIEEEPKSRKLRKTG